MKGIITNKDPEYAKAQLAELKRAHLSDKLSKAEYLRELKFLEEEGLIETKKMEEDEFNTLVRANALPTKIDGFIGDTR